MSRPRGTGSPRPRLLVVDNDPQVGKDLVEILTPRHYCVEVVKGAGSKLVEQARDRARRFRPHVIILDVRLLDDYGEDERGLDLLADLRSGRCIVYSAYLSPAMIRRALRKNVRASFIDKAEPTQSLLDAIREAARECAACRKHLDIKRGPGFASEEILTAMFGHETEIPPDIVDDMLRQLFPEHREITLESLGNGDEPALSRGKSVVFMIQRAGLEPVVVKLAPALKVRQEAERYQKHVHERLSGRFYARLERTGEFWDLGASVYAFLGSASVRLPSFREMYRSEPDPETILRPLGHFFRDTWRRHYEKAASSYEQPLFKVYDQALHLSRRLEGLAGSGYVPDLPGFPVPLGDPASWALEHLEESLIADAQHAVTHGDLHGDNIFVDGDRAWAIDFERTGDAHVLRDFAELEVDIITRLASFPEDDWSVFYEFVAALLALSRPADPLAVTPALAACADAAKALAVIGGLRALAHEVTAYTDTREYLWGLFYDALFVASLAPQGSTQQRRALALARLLCDRLDC